MKKIEKINHDGSWNGTTLVKKINEIIEFLTPEETKKYCNGITCNGLCGGRCPGFGTLPSNWGWIQLDEEFIDFGTMEPKTVGETAATGRVGGMLKSIFEPEKDWEKDLSKFYGSMFEDGDFQALHDFIERVIFQSKKPTDEQNHKLQEASNRAYQKGQENGKFLEHQKMKNKINNLVERYETPANDYYQRDLLKDLKNL